MSSQANTAELEAADANEQSNGTAATASQRLAKAAHEGIDKAADIATAAEVSAREKALDAKARAKDAAERAESKSTDVVDQTRKNIEENPLAAAGVAFAVGFVLSALVRR